MTSLLPVRTGSGADPRSESSPVVVAALPVRTHSPAPLFVYLMADEAALPATNRLPDGVYFIAAGAVPAAMVSDSLILLEQGLAAWRRSAQGEDRGRAGTIGLDGARDSVVAETPLLAPSLMPSSAFSTADTRAAYAWPIAPGYVLACAVDVMRSGAEIHVALAIADQSRLIQALAQASGLPASTFIVLPAAAELAAELAASSAADPGTKSAGKSTAETLASDAYGSRPGGTAAAVAALTCLLATERPIKVQGWIFNAMHRTGTGDASADASAHAHAAEQADTAYAFVQMSASIGADGQLSSLHGFGSRTLDAQDSASARAPSNEHHPVYRIEQAGVSADDPFELIPTAAQIFARESFLDEISFEEGRDPIAFRLAHLDAEKDAGARELIGALADRAVWQNHRASGGAEDSDTRERTARQTKQRRQSKGWAKGRGFAFDTVRTPENRDVVLDSRDLGDLRDSHAESEPRAEGDVDQATTAVNAPATAGRTATATYSAWIIDIEVNRTSGEISVQRVIAGQATGQPGARVAGLSAAQITASVAPLTGIGFSARASADNTVDAAGRALSHDLLALSDSFHAGELSTNTPLARNSTEAVMPDSPAEPVIPSAAFLAPAAAALANALFDATGVRFRAPPFTPERVRDALAAQSSKRSRASRDVRADVAREAQPALVPSFGSGTLPGSTERYDPRQSKRRKSSARTWLTLAGLGGVMGLAVSLWPTRAPIEKIARPDVSTYSAETIARGRLIANTGDCAVCHTAAGGQVNAGGLGLDTPFGKVYSTNLTPDVDTGIGGWSYDAFARAMREGISRDGHHLYPAFPYTAFAKISEADMTALYAYLMSQPAVAHTPPATRLPFPFNQRGLMAGWNALYLKKGAYVPDTAKSAEWNRGAYLVEGLGHCSACHSPRNALGAERNGPAYMSGGIVDGWIAPSLTANSRAPVQWTQAALYQYLSTGFSPEHGVAAGPMAPVVSGLATLPASDIHAIAGYIASLNPVVPVADVKPKDAQTKATAPATTYAMPALAETPSRAAALDGDALTQGLDSGKRIFDTACAVCHAATGGVGNFGVRPLLSLNTSVSESLPDNLLRIIQDGIDAPATDALGYMPSFKESLDDQQIADLTHFIRARFAPGQPAWTNVVERSAVIRNGVH